jgi:hypothetical protein
MAFIIIAAFEASPNEKSVAIRPIIRKSGAPGGCPTCSLNAERMNSPQSQKLTVGSRVRRYTTVETPKRTHPVILFRRRKLPHIEFITDVI